ncbi:hypothetical protein GCHA_4072 [Paraglaciecola chathamensis S18K6]|uniref:Uncharacterized protein n=2 Tax=Paraglaciecola chathamensis TaxID=368405 RepID=A0ABQ0IAS0_9ALTE|nr:hypothetical protein GAGA_3625 [Paraglaciecola agarilytica NO2]GAC11998.1 hypothetical protein GCHA_4072 [Paraglaciecola chathamensis S18K6]
MGHNGEAAPRVCVPANVVSEFIGLLADIANNYHRFLVDNELISKS